MIVKNKVAETLIWNSNDSSITNKRWKNPNEQKKRGFLLLNLDQNDITWQGFYLTEVFKMLQMKCDMKIILLFIDSLNKQL